MSNVQSPNSFMLTLFGFEKTKSGAHILLVILIHALGWCLLFFLPVLLYPVRINDDRFITWELIDKAILVLLFYLNYYFLIPRFFENKKYLIYFSLILLLFLIYFVQRVAVRANYFPRPGSPFQLFVQGPGSLHGKPDSLIQHVAFNNGDSIRGASIRIDSTGIPAAFTRSAGLSDNPDRLKSVFNFRESSLFGIPKGAWLFTLNNAISSFTLLLLMGGFIRLAYSFIRNQNEKKASENANLNAEVNFLKSQINPHFLFNTLNTIYSQAHNKSEHTEYSILKLSDLLRYVLYDSGEKKVQLAKDIRYLTNYIDLQKFRLSQKITIQYEITGITEGKQIAPLLLITFVENAFKHGISYTNPSTIDINIWIFEQTLTLLVSNPLTETDSFTNGGLGLKNVKRRLDLLYPGKYLLDIVHNEHMYIVNLKINLDQ